jgi:hypothetical protein
MVRDDKMAGMGDLSAPWLHKAVFLHFVPLGTNDQVNFVLWPLAA